MTERTLRFDLVSRWDSRGVKLADRDIARFGRNSTRHFDRAGTDAGRRFGMRMNKSLGGGISTSVGIVRKGAGAMGLAFGAVGIVSLAKDAVDLAATFDKTMRQTAAVAKVPAKQMKELRDVALDMGMKTSFSAREAGNAMFELGKGGLSFAQMKAGALSSTLTLAAAGGIDLADAAQFVVKGLTTFGLKADKAASVAAALAGGANASTASVEDMGLALAQTGQGAHNAGLSIQETTAVLAAFADNGLRGSDAGTSLKTMLARLVPQTKKQRDAMRELNLDFTDANGAMLPISDIAQQLKDRFKGLSAEQRIAAMNTVFGSDATRAATILMREGEGGLRKYIKATNDRAAAERLAKTNTSGAAGAFERLSGAIETVKIKAGTTILPMLADVAVTIADRVIPAISKWVSQFRSDLLPHLGRMKDAWDANKGAIAGLVTGLAGSQGQMGETATKAKTMADAVVAISNAAGDTSRALTNLGNGLNNIQAGSERFGSSIRNNVTGPADAFIYKIGKATGVNKLFGLILGDVKRDLADVGIKFGETAGKTKTWTAAANDNTAALRAEKDAVNALKSALQGEEAAELDVRQAKLNVASAQRNLTGLVKSGRKGSLEYRQAQIDLQRAQIDLRDKTASYKNQQKLAAAATGGAARAAQNAKVPYDKFGAAARAAGLKALVMGRNAREGINRIKSKSVSITATFGFKAGKTLGKTSIHDIVGATGGYVTGSAITPRRLHRGGFLQGPGTETSDSIPARLSKGEYVVRAKAVKAVGRDTLDDINAQGFAAGGPVLNAKFPDGSRIGRVTRRFNSVIDKAIARMGAKMDAYADKLAAAFVGTGKPGVTRFIRSTDPLPYIWGGAGPGGYDCSGLVGAVHLAHLGKPYGHGQRIYTTSSIRQGAYGLKPGLGGVLEIGVTAGTGHMAGRYGGKKGLAFEAESSRTGIKVGAAASTPESFARKYHLAKGGPVEEKMVARLAEFGLDVGGDRDKLRVNGVPFAKGGYLNPRAFPYAKHLLQRIRSRAPLYEDFTWRGMPRSYGQWNDDVQRALSEQYRLGNRLPLSKALGRLIHISAYRARSFDRGGTLAPGVNVVANRTGRPEPLTPTSQMPSADDIGKAVARHLAANPVVAVTYLDRQKVSRGVATEQLWQRRR